VRVGNAELLVLLNAFEDCSRQRTLADETPAKLSIFLLRVAPLQVISLRSPSVLHQTFLHTVISQRRK